MNTDLKKNRMPFSLEEALRELNLSTSEFVDFVSWANISTIVAIPRDRIVRIFYENENFSFTPEYYQPHESEHQAQYLKIPSATLKTIAIGGKIEISRFDAMISTDGKSVTTEELHESIHSYFVKHSNSQSVTTFGRSKSVAALYQFHTGPEGLKKWFGITQPRPALPPSPFQQNSTQASNSSELSWVMQSQRLTAIATHSSTIKEPQSDLQQGSQMEFFLFSVSDSLSSPEKGSIHISVDNTKILFLPAQIYDLQLSLEALPLPTQEEPTNLDILNAAARIFHTDIVAIIDPSRYWRENKETSKIVDYIRANIKLKSIETIEYCTRVLVNDDSILVDPLPEVSFSTAYPDTYLEALKRLNEVGAVERSAPSRTNRSATERAKRFENYGFKPRATHHLKAVLNKK